MRDKFVEDGEGLEVINPAVEIVRPGDEGHIDDSDGEFGKVAEPGEPDEEYQELTEAQLDLFRVLSPERPALDEVRARLQRTLERALRRQGTQVVAAVRSLLETIPGATKADEPDTPPPVSPLLPWVDEITAAAISGLGSWDFVFDSVGDALEDAATDAAQTAIAVIGPEREADLFEQVSERSVRMSRERAAELIGKRVLPDGSIVDNPNAEWAISDSTRDMIRHRIQQVIADNEGSDALIEALETEHAFSPARAQMVARTEIADINSRAQMDSYRAAEEAGVELKKSWILGPKPCEVCRENAAQGPIPLEQTFQSGDDTSPAHPNCVCAVIPEVQ